MCGMMPLRVSETDPTAVPYGYTGGISPHACAVLYFLFARIWLSFCDVCFVSSTRFFFPLTSYRQVIELDP